MRKLLASLKTYTGSTVFSFFTASHGVCRAGENDYVRMGRLCSTDSQMMGVGRDADKSTGSVAAGSGGDRRAATGDRGDNWAARGHHLSVVGRGDNRLVIGLLSVEDVLVNDPLRKGSARGSACAQ